MTATADRLLTAAHIVRTAATRADKEHRGLDWTETMADTVGGNAGLYAVVMSPALGVALADWLESEALFLQAIPPMVDLFNFSAKLRTGTDATLRLGYREDGEIAMVGESTEAALTVANVIIATAEYANEAFTDRKAEPDPATAGMEPLL